MHYKMIYMLALAGLFLLFYASLGNGLTGEAPEWTDWKYRLFHGVCHQQPERSLRLNGVQMAVNARCSGIFSGLLAGWLLIPVAVKRLRAGSFSLKLLAGAFLLNCVDFAAGFFPVWNSSNFSRFFLGTVLGLAVAAVMADLFRKLHNDKEQMHGTDRP